MGTLYGWPGGGGHVINAWDSQPKGLDTVPPLVLGMAQKKIDYRMAVSPDILHSTYRTAMQRFTLNALSHAHFSKMVDVIEDCFEDR